MVNLLDNIIFLIFSVQCVCNTHPKIANIASIFTDNLIPQIQVLHGGLSSPGLYKFRNNDKEYVLRLSHPNRSIFERDRTIQCYKLASDNGIAPTIKYTSSDKGVIVSEYINGNYVSKTDLRSKKLLTELAKTIKKLHSIDGFPSSKDIFTIRQSFEKQALLLNSSLVLKASKYLKLVDRILLKDKVTLVATHNDLKPENILFDNKFMIIDWEAACLGYPCFDLATILVFYNLSDDEQDEFLEAYYNRKPSIIEKERINLFKQEVLGYYGMAYLMLSVYKKLPPLSLEEIYNLPELYDYLENKFLQNDTLDSYLKAQKLGWILIKKINENDDHVRVMQ
jgi:hypothetical protein